MKKRNVRYVAIAFFCVCIIAILISLLWGSYTLSLQEVIDVFLGNGNTLSQVTVLRLRLPRICLAILVGSALAVSGSLLQGMSKNDLADPGIIGINAGASFGAVFYIFLLGDVYYQALQGFSIFLLPIMAMLGACFSAVLLYVLSSHGGLRPQRMLLTGIGLNIAFNALISFISFKGSSADYSRVLIWTNGSLWGSNWEYVVAVAPIIILTMLMVCYRHKTLDVLSLGDDVATSLGVDVKKERTYSFCFAVLLAGSATAVAGNISFLGLLGPHIAKTIVGFHHKHFLPIAILISSTIILFADSVSRNLFSPLEIPTGITISIIGVPYFIYLMMKEKS